MSATNLNFNLPAAQIADKVNISLAQKARLVVTAPPGAGKSTLLPLTILEGLEDGGRILMLEPRRIAARQIAERMAFLSGCRCGEKVGYRIRFESKVSADTRIEVLTEGILTRMMIDDPTLDGVSAIIFDEFHERSIASDTALALALETQKLIRPDLKIVIMSATIDAHAICRYLDAPLIQSEGRMHPVEIIHTRELVNPADAAAEVCHFVRQAHKEHEGDILAFLPGEAEIRRCAELLGQSLGNTSICPLYGFLPFEEQQKAIAPGKAGERKVVLATPIAETSLTIEGVRIVVDSGLCRKMVFSQQNGLSRMETVRISRDMADQRSGRAGRVAPGVCYRLWSLSTEQYMPLTRIPEISEADLAPMMLDIAAWGGGDIDSLQWLTRPEPQALKAAHLLLRNLCAIDDQGSITSHGRRLSALPCHPRIAQMLLKAETPELRSLASDIAAILDDRDPVPDAGSSDICIRINELRLVRTSGRISRGWSRIVRTAEQYRRLAKAFEDNSPADPYSAGALIAAAYPERIARAHNSGLGRFLLSGGNIASLDKDDALTMCEWIAAAGVNANKDNCGRIFMAAPLDSRDIKSLARERDNISWDSKNGEVIARHELTIGCLTLDSRSISTVSQEQVTEILCNAAAKDGMSMFNFAADDVQNLQRRIAAVSLWHPEMNIPDVTAPAMISRVREWLPMFAGKARSSQELRKIDMKEPIWSTLTYEQQQSVDRLAPTHIQVASGSRIRVEYRQGADAPVLRVRLQECFGMKTTPCVDGGRCPVLMELLSPGFKPVQLTKDLESFWKNTYFEVRKELKRRYPKHAWPEEV